MFYNALSRAASESAFAYGSGALPIFLLLRGKPEARRSRFLIGVCFFNLALFAGYKLSLSMDAA